MCRLSYKDESQRARIFCRVSLHFHFLSKEFSGSITSSEKDNRGSEKTLVACQYSTVRLSFICQSKLVRPYQRETVKGNGNDLFKQKIKKENAAV